MMASNENTDKRKLFYWVTGEIVLLVDHPVGTQPSPQDLLEALRETVTDDSARQALKELQFDLERTQTFNLSDTDQPLLPLRDQSTSFSLMFAHAGPRPPRDEPPDPALRKIVPIIEQLNDFAAETWNQETGGTTLRAASPNWLITPFTQDAAGGSPGARPLEVVSGTSTPRFTFDGSASLPREVEEGAGGKNVEVVILDTVPSPEQMREALNDSRGDNELFQKLYKTVTITYVGEMGVALPAPDDFRVRGHDYPMSDHGLFIAGIVRQLAPEATIRIVEVLNEYGVGTLETIGCGLKYVLEQQSAAPLVINCSFGMTTPLAGHPTTDLEGWSLFAERPSDDAEWHLFPERPGAKRAAQVSSVFAMPKPWARKMRQTTLALETLCALSTRPNVRIVAAAGNDGEDPDQAHSAALGLKRPQARYPAAFPTVIGVGAIGEDGSPTRYSNLSDDPSFEGYATFGGVASSGLAAPNTGILGVYIGEFPGGQGHAAAVNTTGWAWWAGTSFATPIISALLANLAAAELSSDPNDAVDRALSRLPTLLSSDTGVGPTIPVEQTP